MSIFNHFEIGKDNKFSVYISELLEDKRAQFLIRESDKNDFLEGRDEFTPSFVKTVEKKIQPINEETYKSLLSKSDPARKRRSKKLTGWYRGIDPKRGWLVFQTTSQFTIGKKYTQYIALKDVKDLKYLKEFNSRDIARLLLSGDIGVRCTCKDFQYRYTYMAHTMGYGLYRELRYPKIRNPQLKGRLCKHLILVMMLMQTNLMRIQKDMKNSKYYKKKLSSLDR